MSISSIVGNAQSLTIDSIADTPVAAAPKAQVVKTGDSLVVGKGWRSVVQGCVEAVTALFPGAVVLGLCQTLANEGYPSQESVQTGLLVGALASGVTIAWQQIAIRPKYPRDCEGAVNTMGNMFWTVAPIAIMATAGMFREAGPDFMDLKFALICGAVAAGINRVILADRPDASAIN